ncbi:MAG: ASCH domain-containing protein [Oscillospiraceae bacterium]|nr:ASCH domain-containing protein [Oscillospiraceae bacterium]
MKAITIWQPFASLVAIGAKKFETRSWKTSYRGKIAIHAAKKPFTRGLFSDTELYRFVDSLGLPDIYSFDELPYSVIVATAELVEIHKILVDPKTHRIGLISSNGYQGGISLCSKEIVFGDYSYGRYAWELDNVKIFNEPIPASGKQRLWEWNGGYS